MRTFKNYMDGAKRRKLEETGEEGFSLIELIIVVVILGILVAIAIPLFANIQAQAQTNALKAAAANGATAAAAALAQTGGTPALANAAAVTAGDPPITVALTPQSPATIDLDLRNGDRPRRLARGSTSWPWLPLGTADRCRPDSA